MSSLSIISNKDNNVQVTIVDAKDSGMKFETIRAAVDDIQKKELREDTTSLSASYYVKESYFTGKNEKNDLFHTRAILLAKVANDVVGFIIMNRNNELVERITENIAYLAVDSSIKKSGVGTKLMLAAMQKTKEFGKRFLVLEYIPEGKRITPERGKAKTEFYNSISKKFKIPMDSSPRKGFEQTTTRLVYDLKEISG